jgi:hypothetical protein
MTRKNYFGRLLLFAVDGMSIALIQLKGLLAYTKINNPEILKISGLLNVNNSQTIIAPYAL